MLPAGLLTIDEMCILITSHRHRNICRVTSRQTALDTGNLHTLLALAGAVC